MNQIGGAHHNPHHHHHLYQDSTLVKHHRERLEEKQKSVNQTLSEMVPYDEVPQDLSRRFPPLPVRYPGYPPPPPPPPQPEIKTEPSSPAAEVTVKTEPEDPGYGVPLVTFPHLPTSFPLEQAPAPPERGRQETPSSRTIIGSLMESVLLVL